MVCVEERPRAIERDKGISVCRTSEYLAGQGVKFTMLNGVGCRSASQAMIWQAIEGESWTLIHKSVLALDPHFTRRRFFAYPMSGNSTSPLKSVCGHAFSRLAGGLTFARGKKPTGGTSRSWQILLQKSIETFVEASTTAIPFQNDSVQKKLYPPSMTMLSAVW